MIAPIPRGQKKCYIDRARSILRGRELFEPLACADEDFLAELIARHPDSLLKVGAGIDHFEVRPDGWGGRCFWIVRVDSTATDFSFLSCLKAPTPRQDFAAACRHAVVDQVLAFKELAFADTASLSCPVTGEPVTRETCHIDHAPPWTFDDIVTEFALGRDLSADVEPTADGCTFTRFRDPATARAFAEFHAERAVLRVVSRRANLSILRRGPQS